jgi:hypothetical protein
MSFGLIKSQGASIFKIKDKYDVAFKIFNCHTLLMNIFIWSKIVSIAYIFCKKIFSLPYLLLGQIFFLVDFLGQTLLLFKCTFNIFIAYHVILLMNNFFYEIFLKH